MRLFFDNLFLYVFLLVLLYPVPLIFPLPGFLANPFPSSCPNFPLCPLIRVLQFQRFLEVGDKISVVESVTTTDSKGIEVLNETLINR